MKRIIFINDNHKKRWCELVISNINDTTDEFLEKLRFLDMEFIGSY